MTSSEAILEDLKKSFGSRRVVLYSEDLAELLGTDHRVVKSLAKGLSIPLNMKKVGNRWGVSIYSVAEWLAESDKLTRPSTSRSASNPLGTPARRRASLGRSLLALKTQRDFLDELMTHLQIMEHELEQVLAAEDRKAKRASLTKKKHLPSD